MKNILIILLLMVIASGCASKMVYLNSGKPPEEVQKDKDDCQMQVDASDFKDTGLKQNKFEQCMKDKGYNVVSEDKAEEIQGFKGLWVNPQTDFKAYEAIFVDNVDLSEVKERKSSIPDSKITDEEINNLGVEMLKRFSKALDNIMPVISRREDAAGKKVLYVGLKLNNISQTNVGLSATLGVAGHFSPVPLPGGPEGTFSFEGVIEDFSEKERLITISDETKSSKNSAFVGGGNFSRWQKAYNIMDYWADHLAGLLAKLRGEAYKSKLRIKIF